jgi:hypothetical protein
MSRSVKTIVRELGELGVLGRKLRDVARRGEDARGDPLDGDDSMMGMTVEETGLIRQVRL